MLIKFSIEIFHLRNENPSISHNFPFCKVEIEAPLLVDSSGFIQDYKKADIKK